MARIRTVKPDFFRHLGLYRLEVETGLPVRVAFAGLWTAADREGRFKWIPEELKLDCLPFDVVDFSRVLDALATREHIVKYSVNGAVFGFIPSWHDHQVINNRETASSLPEPTESSIASATCTRDPRVNDACGTPLVQDQGEGKGKEGKGREGDSPEAAHRSRPGNRAEPPTNAAWHSYAKAYASRYGVEPVRNRTVNGQMSQFIARVSSDEAPDIAAFYVRHDNALYRSAQHPVNLLLRDAESLRTQWATGRKVEGRVEPLSFGERETARKAARYAEMTGGLIGQAAPAPGDFIDMEPIDGTARLLG